MQTAPSDNFYGQVGQVLTMLRDEHPDPRVREGIARERFKVYGAPTAEDLRLASGWGKPLQPDDVLLALHVGTPQVPQQRHEIRLYEQGIREAAQQQGMSVADQIQESALHELEHHFGWCPSGHTDCGQQELTATLAAGGTLDAAQTHAVAGPVQAHVACGCAH